MSGYMNVLDGKYAEFKSSLNDTWEKLINGESQKNFDAFNSWKKLAIIVTVLVIGVLGGAVVSQLPLGSLLSVPSIIFTAFVTFAYLTKSSIDNSYVILMLSYLGK